MNRDFINLVKNGAIRAWKEHGVLSSLTIAQAILESGWGEAAVGNNLFGIKWQEGCGYGRQLLPTNEYVDGHKITIQDWFRKYESLGDSIYDHAMFLVANSRYNNLLWVNDYKTVCNLIQADGYATDPNYTKQLIQIIEENKLYEIDKEGEDEEVIKIPDASNCVPFMGGWIEAITEQNRIIFHKNEYDYISFIEKEDSTEVSIFSKSKLISTSWNNDGNRVANSNIFKIVGNIEVLPDRVVFHRSVEEYISLTNDRANKVLYVDLYSKNSETQRVEWR